MAQPLLRFSTLSSFLSCIILILLLTPHTSASTTHSRLLKQSEEPSFYDSIWGVPLFFALLTFLVALILLPSMCKFYTQLQQLPRISPTNLNTELAWRLSYT